MRRFAGIVLKFRVPIIVVTLLATLIFGYFLKNLTINSDILSYLPQDDPLVVLFNEVGDKFGGNSLAMVALESDDAFSHANLTRVDEITRRFRLRRRHCRPRLARHKIILFPCTPPPNILDW